MGLAGGIVQDSQLSASSHTGMLNVISQECTGRGDVKCVLLMPVTANIN